MLRLIKQLLGATIRHPPLSGRMRHTRSSAHLAHARAKPAMHTSIQCNGCKGPFPIETLRVPRDTYARTFAT